VTECWSFGVLEEVVARGANYGLAYRLKSCVQVSPMTHVSELLFFQHSNTPILHGTTVD
jgi:hypothetical protein